MKKWIFVLVAAILSVLIWRFVPAPSGDPGGGRRGQPMEVAVETEHLARGEIRDLRVFTGTLRPRARFIVAPKISGRLEFIEPRIGDAVLPGQLLARLDDEEFALQVEQAAAARDVARARVEQQKTELELAERELERAAELHARGIAAEAEWEAAEARAKNASALLRTARAQLEERQSALRTAEVRLAYTRISAPDKALPDSRWVVDERFVDEGAMLAANNPLLAVVDIGRLTAEIAVIEKDYAEMRTGLSAAIETDAVPGRPFTGQVARLSPSFRESSRQARVEVDLANDPPLLRPGLFVRASIEFGRRRDAVLAPRQALVTRHGRPGLFVIDPDTDLANFVEVNPGYRSDGMVEIRSPELTGEVVTLGHHLLTDGTAVTIRRPPASGDDLLPGNGNGRTPRQ